MAAVLMKTPTKSFKGYSERHPNEGGLPVASVLPSHGHAQKRDKARTLPIAAYYSSARSWLSGEGLDHRQQSTRTRHTGVPIPDIGKAKGRRRRAATGKDRSRDAGTQILPLMTCVSAADAGPWRCLGTLRTCAHGR